MLFKDVVGQQPAKEGLMKMWHNNVFPHALLLVGNEGTGGLPMGLALAQFIFCTEKTENDSCGHCVNCRKVSRLEHADVHMTFPTIPPKPGNKGMSKLYIQEFREFIQKTPYGTTYEWLQHINAENKQGNIVAEECREIIDTLNLKSYEGGRKVQIIWRPEYLRKEGNILLKLIEEPPHDTTIIFIAEDLEDILPTILSRTQSVKLAPLHPKDVAEALTFRSVTDPTRAAQIAHIAMGSYTEALRLANHTDNDLFPGVKDLFNSIFTNNGIALTKFADEWSKAGREQQKNFLHYIIQLLEQAIRARYTPDMPLSLPESEAQFVKKLAATKTTFDAFDKMIGTITDTMFYIERNAHSKTQLLAMAVRMQYMVSNKPLPAGV